MQVFEFHFNPPKEEELASGQAKLIFDSFYYEPKNIYEKRVGSLYLAGLLKNVLPQNLRFLDNLAKSIKENYYNPTLRSPEKSLKESLKQANEFLENIVKKGDVSWLGNLSFAVLSFVPHRLSGGGGLNFTKVGDFKIFLLRKGHIIDIDKRLKFQDIEPYPLKIFGNIVSTKLAEDDIILVLSKEVSDYFLKENLINEIAGLSSFDSKKIKEIFSTKEEGLLKIFGICSLIFLSKQAAPRKKEVIPAKFRAKDFSLKEIFNPLARTSKNLIRKPRSLKLLKFPTLPKIGLPKIRLPRLRIRIKLPKLKLPKNVIPILALISFLALGFFVFEKEKKEQLKEYQATLMEAQEKLDLAESFLILKNLQTEKEANLLLEESFEKISPLVKIASTLPSSLSSQVFSLKEEISKNLYQLNKLIEISEPELLFEFDAREFIPQKVVSDGEGIYFFSPYSQNLFKVNKDGGGQLIQTDKKFNLAVSLDDSILFLSEPDQLLRLKEGQLSEPALLESPYPDFSSDSFSSYKLNLYFLDKEAGKIIKYPYLEELKWGAPQFWLENKKAIGAKSMAVDGGAWLLNKQNSIDRYYAGNFRETINLDFFPYPKNLSKIFTSSSLSYLYLLEPEQSRIVILTKSGQILKQFQSEEFDNLLDFSVSKDGKTIYLLNGQKVYKIANSI